MNIDDYQQQAITTLPEHLEQVADYALIGLAGEVGEVMELCKKHYYHSAREQFIDKLTEELGDVCWYIAVIAHQHGLKFSELLEAQIQKQQKRHGDKYNPDFYKDSK